MNKYLKVILLFFGVLIYTSGVCYLTARTFNIKAHVQNSNGLTWAALPLDASGNLKIAIQ